MFNDRALASYRSCLKRSFIVRFACICADKLVPAVCRSSVWAMWMFRFSRCASRSLFLTLWPSSVCAAKFVILNTNFLVFV